MQHLAVSEFDNFGGFAHKVRKLGYDSQLMAVKFRAPDKPKLVDEKDWNPLSRRETDSSEPLKTAPKDPSIAKGFQRLIDFVKKEAKTQAIQKQDPARQLKLKGIEAYKKMKKVA